MPFDGAFSSVHILIVAVVALLILGPEQLPKIARQVGNGVREFKRVQQHLKTELRDVVSEFDAHTNGSAAPSEAVPSLPPSEPDSS
jgi:sec-independent protein translocase protein TatA